MVNDGFDMFQALNNVINKGRIRALDNVTLEKFKALDIKTHNYRSVRIPTGRTGANGRAEYKSIGHSTFTIASGEIEESEWYKRARNLIQESGETDIYKRLLLYSKDCGWFKTQDEIEHYALDLHIGRIFERPNWVYYQDFNSGRKWTV